MPVEMARQSGTGGGTQIQPDVVTLRVHQLIDFASHVNDLGLQVGRLLRCQTVERADMPNRTNEQVTRVVREAVENRHRAKSSFDNQIGAVIRGRESAANEA